MSFPLDGVVQTADTHHAEGLRASADGDLGEVPVDERRPNEKENVMLELLALSGTAATLLWIVAAVLVIAGIVWIVRGSVAAGIVMIIVGLLIGPGGVSIFK
jgi:hypothetical protein